MIILARPPLPPCWPLALQLMHMHGHWCQRQRLCRRHPRNRDCSCRVRSHRACTGTVCCHCPSLGTHAAPTAAVTKRCHLTSGTKRRSSGRPSATSTSSETCPSARASTAWRPRTTGWWPCATRAAGPTACTGSHITDAPCLATVRDPCPAACPASALFVGPARDLPAAAAAAPARTCVGPLATAIVAGVPCPCV